jgi:phosphatidylserine/phosphatidylglycerophosphate/cardiolipin synthase-like enzyme
MIGGQEYFSRIGEAVEAAQHSIWVTVAFLAEEFQFPGVHGSVFDFFDRAVARGVDVRLVVWRPNPEAGDSLYLLRGDAKQLGWLGDRGSKVKIRWDRANGKYCHHQKSWVIDAGHPNETTFVGGANITPGGIRFQDVFVELTGLAMVDVRENFAQRWNRATERYAVDGNWSVGADDTLVVPTATPAADGRTTVQIARMLPTTGERSIVEQYRQAIGAARRTIYIENQAIPIMEIAEPLLQALNRGVQVVLLVPSTPEKYVFAARLDPQERSRFEGVEALAGHPSFLMAGLGPTYVHSKLMIVDDCWVTIGSCNLHAFSLRGHSEMNIAIWDADVASALRRRLFATHLGANVAALDESSAFHKYREAAVAGHGVFVLDPLRYGLE